MASKEDSRPEAPNWTLERELNGRDNCMGSDLRAALSRRADMLYIEDTEDLQAPMGKNERKPS